MQLTEAQGLFLLVLWQLVCLGFGSGGFVQQLPFAGVAEQRVAFVEVAGTEGLQWMLLGHRFEERLLALGVVPAAGEMVA